MPTVRGWAVFALGVILWVLGRVFGAPPLEHMAIGVVALPLIAVGVVRFSKHELAVTRRISPARSRAEQLVNVDLTLVNRGWGTAPLVLLNEDLPRQLGSRARFTVQGIEPDGKRQVSVQLRPPRRGHYSVGPLTTVFIDPFGLAKVTSRAAGQDSFLVHPRVEMLSMPHDRSRQRVQSLSALRQLTGARGEDFYTMREYVEGDDLRKIHWPATAKRGRPMIRQEETPWHTRATILLDDRAEVHSPGPDSSFERAVEAAASLVDLYNRTGYSYRLVTAHDPGVATSRGNDHLHRCLDLLAVAQMRADTDDILPTRMGQLDASGGAEGSFWFVTGGLTPQSVSLLVQGTRRFRYVAVVSFPVHRFGAADTKKRWEGERATVEAVRLLTKVGVSALVVGPDEPLSAVWSASLRKITSDGERPWGRKPELV